MQSENQCGGMLSRTAAKWHQVSFNDNLEDR